MDALSFMLFLHVKRNCLITPLALLMKFKAVLLKAPIRNSKIET